MCRSDGGRAPMLVVFNSISTAEDAFAIGQSRCWRSRHPASFDTAPAVRPSQPARRQCVSRRRPTTTAPFSVMPGFWAAEGGRLREDASNQQRRVGSPVLSRTSVCSCWAARSQPSPRSSMSAVAGTGAADVRIGHVWRAGCRWRTLRCAASAGSELADGGEGVRSMQREAAEPKGTNRCVVGERRKRDGRPVGMLHHRVAGRDRGEDVPVSDNDEAAETALRVGIALARDVVAKVCGNDLRVFEMVLANVDLHVGRIAEARRRRPAPVAALLPCASPACRRRRSRRARPGAARRRAARRLRGAAGIADGASVRSSLLFMRSRVKLMEARVRQHPSRTPLRDHEAQKRRRSNLASQLQ